MKRSLSFIICILAGCMLQGCWWVAPIDPLEEQYDAVAMNRGEFENSVQTLSSQPIVKSGKIYIQENLMFVNDVNKGFQVYNYADPENPLPIGFINIPGATDLAMRNNVIFINQAVDLVTLTYNPSNNSIVVNHRNRNVFPQKLAPNGWGGDIEENEIIVDWIEN